MKFSLDYKLFKDNNESFEWEIDELNYNLTEKYWTCILKCPNKDKSIYNSIYFSESGKTIEEAIENTFNKVRDYILDGT